MSSSSTHKFAERPTSQLYLTPEALNLVFIYFRLYFRAILHLSMLYSLRFIVQANAQQIFVTYFKYLYKNACINVEEAYFYIGEMFKVALNPSSYTLMPMLFHQFAFRKDREAWIGRRR